MRQPHATETPLAQEEYGVGRLRPRLELALTAIGILVTVVASGLAGVEMAEIGIAAYHDGAAVQMASLVVFAAIAAFLVYGGLVYQVCRIGYLLRRMRHRTPDMESFDAFFAADEDEMPAVTVLVPSYKEEERVILQTLLSAALQFYPNRRVVLLIDDPPLARNDDDIHRLDTARALPRRVERLLSPMALRFGSDLDSFAQRHPSGTVPRAELDRVVACYRDAAAWFATLIGRWPQQDHSDRLFVDKVLRRNEELLRAMADHMAARQGEIEAAQLLVDYRRLVSLFAVEVEAFERKIFANLSHEPNKAMNLNSYMALVARSFREVEAGGRLLLLECAEEDADLVVPDTDYFLTLDADSVILSDYALRLVAFMEDEANARVAVVQTPYSAIPGAPSALERIAGATTDIQYIIHQGFTCFSATYWVGANALLRKEALRDIAVQQDDDGLITSFIQDRTVIEDTESSIDLVAAGWSLHNYPERLSYSATPPDFGALLIQRRRWANGGLIILPKLLRQILHAPLSLGLLLQAFVRCHYLSSIAAVNIGLVLVLTMPLATEVESFWLPLSALPYFLLYGRDLRLVGHRFRDVVSVYAFNLLLIPVNLGGVFKSIHQGLTRTKTPFGRTPKVEGRTATAPLYVAGIYALLLHCLVGACVDTMWERWTHAVFALCNGALLGYALVTFIGLRESWQDLVVGLQKPAPQAEPTAVAMPITTPTALSAGRI